MTKNQIQQLTATDLANWLVQNQNGCYTILDVREQWEFEICHLPDSIHIPLNQITSRIEELSANIPTVCVCHHGIRSLRAAIVLANQGFKEIYNLQGGIDAWSQWVDPSCPKY